MFFKNDGQLEAINRSFAVIHFDLTGKILQANDNFLNTMGYSLEEIKGKQHKMFVFDLANYQDFWSKLNSGAYDEGVYKRRRKDGSEIWLSATYSPVYKRGKLVKVVKYAKDVTQEQLEKANFLGQIKAINRAQAVIEFDLTGKILRANDNFLGVVGFTEAEIMGRHHSIFLYPEDKNTLSYQSFWSQLAKGQMSSGIYRRSSKEGAEIWLQASYNPIFDSEGRLLKVVKYATDITQSVKANKILEESFQRLSSAVADSESNAVSARDIVQNASGHVLESADIMGEIITTMTDITSSSESIANITELLDAVSFQTNLLAINAKIEAAHAGSKGFAVVADEVRNLSKESAESSKKIKNLIDACMDKIHRGSKLVERASSIVSNSSDAIKSASSMMQTIQSNAVVQNAGINDIKIAIGYLKK